MKDSDRADLQKMQRVLEIRKAAMAVALETNNVNLYTAVLECDHFAIFTILHDMTKEAMAEAERLKKSLREDRPYADHIGVLVRFNCQITYADELAAVRDEARMVNHRLDELGEAGRRILAMPLEELMRRVAGLEAWRASSATAEV